MIRGVEFYVILWAVVTVLILVYKELARKEKISVIKAILFGALTALIAISIVVFIVILF